MEENTRVFGLRITSLMHYYVHIYVRIASEFRCKTHDHVFLKKSIKKKRQQAVAPATLKGKESSKL